jgi:toxin ParE1/3/4
MAEVIWSPSALDDVDAIAEYIARDSVDQAALFATRLIEATDRLADFPGSGRIIP